MARFGSMVMLFLGLVALAHGANIFKFSFEEELLVNVKPTVPGPGQDDRSLPGPVLEVVQWLNSQRSHSVEGFSWNNCGKPSKVLQIKDLTVTPDPVKEGSSAHVSIAGNLTEDIPAPIAVDVLLEIKYVGVWHKVPCTHGLGSCSYPDICAKMPPGRCPLKKRSFSLSKVVQVPTGPPAATYRLTGNMKSAQGFLACIQILVDLVK